MFTLFKEHLQKNDVSLTDWKYFNQNSYAKLMVKCNFFPNAWYND